MIVSTEAAAFPRPPIQQLHDRASALLNTTIKQNPNVLDEVEELHAMIETHGDSVFLDALEKHYNKQLALWTAQQSPMFHQADVTRHPNNKRALLDAHVLFELYIEREYTAKEISLMLGVNQRALERRLNDLGINKREWIVSKDQVKEMLQYLKSTYPDMGNHGAAMMQGMY